MTEQSHAIVYYLPQELNWLIYINSYENGDPTYINRDDVVGNITGKSNLE